MEKTSPENLERINQMFRELSKPAKLPALAARWADERKFEDIDDYRKVIVRWLPSDFIVSGMIKRPFGFTFTIIGVNAEYKVFAKAKAIGWNRVK